MAGVQFWWFTSEPYGFGNRRCPDGEELSSVVQPGQRGAGRGSGGAEPEGSGVFRIRPARFGTAEQTNASTSASALQIVSAAGGSGEGERAAADRAGND